ncbi:MAG: DNA repair protein RecN, partial [Bacteroidales bacterium]|nr:DNA repair protein RecN [Bacteroidales bacterium]
MLTSLLVKNYVLIDSLEIDFPEGLIIITGQTGAGKSIILGALSLVLGSKADAGAISQGAENCVVEARFKVDSEDSSIKGIFEENDLDWEDGEIVIRRTVARSGRSRCFINDIPVTLPVLSSLSPLLIDIHSQHQTLLLSDKVFQMSILDRFAGDQEQLREMGECYREVNSINAEREALDARIAAAQRDRDYNESQWTQLDRANLKDGELEELEAEHKLLANAEEIQELLSACEALAAPSIDGNEIRMTDSMKEMERHLGKLSRFIQPCSELVSRLESCRLEMEDIVSEIDSMSQESDASPERLVEVEERLSLLYSLMKKHDCDSVSALIAVRDALSENLFDSTQMIERRAALEKSLNKALERRDKASKNLHEARQKACAPFAEHILSSLHSLELPRSVFEVSLEPCSVSAFGADSVRFMFNATGHAPVELSKCASGGELSRIMLSLKEMMATLGGMPTMVFDEIDTGVSGSVADKMGSMICSMGERMQVFAITHLPQVAAKGNAHYLVDKTESQGRTISTIKRL